MDGGEAERRSPGSLGTGASCLPAPLKGPLSCPAAPSPWPLPAPTSCTGLPQHPRPGRLRLCALERPVDLQPSTPGLAAPGPPSGAPLPPRPGMATVSGQETQPEGTPPSLGGTAPLLGLALDLLTAQRGLSLRKTQECPFHYSPQGLCLSRIFCL